MTCNFHEYLSQFYQSVVSILNPEYSLVHLNLFRPTRAVAVIFINNHNQILLERCGWDREKLTFPKGAVEHNETFTEAAEREVYEELGIKLFLSPSPTLDLSQNITKFTYSMVDAHYQLVYLIAIKTTLMINEFNPLSRDEVESVFYVGVKELKNVLGQFGKPWSDAQFMKKALKSVGIE
ncbi:NUDIX_hydrolase [Hexamita inflata]|uniref:NUDIX hydrolase n=1 Tax=Hexamita inflata TaxID=28002 RepID=A0AA86UE26_9EUKA|nr:NUDIX hydrolase [Hexamita inflata]